MTTAVTWVIGSDHDAGLVELRDTLSMLCGISPDLAATLRPPSEFQRVEWQGQAWAEATEHVSCALGEVVVSVRLAESGQCAWRIGVAVVVSGN